jgi:hypothetical protein
MGIKIPIPFQNQLYLDGSSVTFAVGYAPEPDSLQDQLQLRAGQGKLGASTFRPGAFKSTFLQPFMKDTETIPFPYQQLDLIGAPVNEDIDLVIQRILIHLVSHYTAKPLKRAAHVGVPDIQEVLYMFVQR